MLDEIQLLQRRKKPLAIMFGMWNVGNENVCFSFSCVCLKTAAEHLTVEQKSKSVPFML